VRPKSVESHTSSEIVLRFARGTPLSAVLPSCLREYTLQSVFARDLAAAQSAGLLTLSGMEIPNELAGCLLGPPRNVHEGLIGTIEESRHFVGRFVAIDGPEYLLASQGRLGVGEFVGDLAIGLRMTGLQGIVNLNSIAPPSWAGELAEGPLFAANQRTMHSEQLRELADELAKTLLHLARASPKAGDLRIDWHLSERDFTTDSAPRERLRPLAKLALEGASLAFVFDRPRRPAALAEGIDRQHPAVLLSVGLNLPQLALQPGIDGDPAKFLAKLGSLARLALSAGVQKREYLRNLERTRRRPTPDAPALTSGFLLDRARLLVAPLGLDCVVHSFVKKGLSAGGAALDFAKQIVLRLRDVLRQDGRIAHLDTCLDGPFRFYFDDTAERGDGWPTAENVAGLTGWDTTAPLKSQLRSVGILHGIAEHGTLALFLPEDEKLSPEQIVEWLRTAWQQTDVVRLRLIRTPIRSRQLTFPAKQE
jgi:hypothetical protein